MAKGKGGKKATKKTTKTAKRSGRKHLSQEIGLSAIKKLAFRAGSTRQNGALLEEGQHALLAKLSSVVAMAALVASKDNRQTIKQRDVELAMRMAGIVVA